MTSLLRRKLRITVPRRRAATAFNLAVLLSLGTTSAFGQFQNRPAYSPPGGQQPAPAASMPGSAGQVMYFCKPADANVPLSGSGAGVVIATGTPDQPNPPPQPPAYSQPGQTGSGASPLIPLPQQTPAYSQPSQALNGFSPALPPPTQPTVQTWAPQGQNNNGGVPNLPTPLSPAQTLAPPNQFSLPDPSNSVQQRMALAPANQYVPAPQPNANPMGIPQVNTQPERKLMTPPDPRVLSPEYRTELPAREVIFQMRDPRALEKWVLEETRASLNIKPSEAGSLKFPDEEKIGGAQVYQAKTSQYPPQQINYQNLFVVHRRLHFEEVNAERYGWDFGILQPLVSTGYFYKDVLLLPYSLASGFTEGFWDSSSGKCLPGSPTPYMLYPPGLSITGGAFEGAVVAGLAAFIP